MDIYRMRIEEVRTEQHTLLLQFRDELARCPTGSIVTGKDHGEVRLYHAYEEDGKYKKRYITNRPTLKQALARKAYLTKVISRLENNLKYLDNALLHLHDLSPGEVIATLPKAYDQLDESSFLTRISYDWRGKESCGSDGCVGSGKGDGTDKGGGIAKGTRPAEGRKSVDPGGPEAYGGGSADVSLSGIDTSEKAIKERIERHREWGNSPYMQSNYRPEGRDQPTTCGIWVRSKSELAIAEKLHSYGIPFHYEQVIPIGRYEYSADFTFECKGNELLYWEHAGMMDDPEYAEKHMKKLQMYHTVGIHLGHNLITTYDVDGKVDINMIDSVIRHQVITRL